MSQKKNFRRKVLKNGMTVVFEKRDLPIVSVAIAIRNGGVNEGGGEKGISHFIEHMLYKGTPTRNARQIALEIERNGGDLNGFTDEEITAYWCKMPSEHLGVALEVLGDMVKNPLFDNNELEKERQVIFEEIKMRKDTPMIYVYDNIQELLYSEPLALPLIGSHKTMNSITKEKMRKKFDAVYQPNNMILCVVGDAEFEEVVKFAEKSFGNKKGRVSVYSVKLKNGERIEKRKGLDQVHLIFAHHVPLGNDKKSSAAQVLSVLMAGGMSSRLFSEIREKRNLAYAVRGSANIHKSFAFNSVYVGTAKKNLELVKKLILEEFEKVSKELDEKELSEIKTQMIGNYHIALEESQLQMVALLYSEIEGDARKFYDFEKRIKTVNLKDVKQLAKQALEKHSFLALVPED